MSSEPTTTVPPASRGNQSSRRVLVADDEDGWRRAVGRMLTGAGFEVVLAADGNAAIEALMQNTFDVILTDINMPGASGVDLLRLVRAYDLDVPVILMTGAPDVKSAVDAVELGALRYLSKPIAIDTLIQAVKRAWQMHRMARVKREAIALEGGTDRQIGDRAGLEMAFERALAKLWIAFQPIVGTVEKRVVAYEALLRTDEPTLPNPSAVLDAAERLHRLNDLGERVRDLTVEAFSAAPPDVLLFVNLHPRDLLNPHLASATSSLSAIAERTVLEVTERASLDDVKGMESRLSILRYMGFRVAVDDLGAGYAGLTSFARLEPEFIKLDMSLIRGVDASLVRQRIVGAMANICNDMAVRVITEGVETEAESAALQKLGCDWMQGYLFGRPQREFVQ